MSQPRTWSPRELATLIGGTVVVDSSATISGVAGIEGAGPRDVTFYEHPRFLAQVRRSSAGAIIVNAPVEGVEAAQIQVDGRPYLKFIELVHVFHPRARPAPGVHPTAVVDPAARLGPEVSVGPLAIIKAGARIGARTIIGSHAYVGPDVHIGEDCHLFPRVVVRRGSQLGDRVFLHCGAVVGDDGFGYVRHDDRHVKIPHIGQVRIEDDVEIGAGTTIDRATFGETVIGAGTKVDNLVMIAHNVKIGARCILAAQVGIAGSSTVGDDTILAGQVGIASGVHVGKNVIVSSKGGVPSNVRDGEIVSGIPAQPHRAFKRTNAIIRRLPKLVARLRAVERKLKIEPDSD